MPTEPKSAEIYADPENSFGYLTRLAFRSFSMALESRTVEWNVTAGQWRFLRALWREDGITQRELSTRAATREPTTVIGLRSLEKAGFIVREQDPKDKRRTLVFLSDHGKAVRKALMLCVAEVNEIALKGMTDADIAILRLLLIRMRENLADEIHVNRRRGTRKKRPSTTYA